MDRLNNRMRTLFLEYGFVDIEYNITTTDMHEQV